MILLYHMVFPDATPPDTWNAGLVLRLKDFKRQIKWLQRFFHIVSLDEYVNHIQTAGKSKARLAALTFDDCYSQTYQVISQHLKDNEIPATFFANTQQLEQDSLLWFVYFNALCFEKVYLELSIEGNRYPLSTQKECRYAWQKLINMARSNKDARKFSLNFSQDYPLPPEIIAKYQGLSKEQLSQIGASHILSLGGHTHSHPYLDQISATEQLVEISYNKELLEVFSPRPVDHFAYTGGVYNTDSIAAVKSAGFKSGFAIQPRQLTNDKLFEIPRTDIYGASLLKFLAKTSGIFHV